MSYFFLNKDLEFAQRLDHLGRPFQAGMDLAEPAHPSRPFAPVSLRHFEPFAQWRGQQRLAEREAGRSRPDPESDPAPVAPEVPDEPSHSGGGSIRLRMLARLSKSSEPAPDTEPVPRAAPAPEPAEPDPGWKPVYAPDPATLQGYTVPAQTGPAARSPLDWAQAR